MPENNSNAKLDAPWAIGSANYATLIKHVDSSVRNIVELGSGESTSQLARDYPDSEILSFDNHASFAKQTRTKLSSAGFKNARVLVRNIRMQLWNGGIFRTYDLSDVDSLPGIDVLLIDGPSERQFPRGREAGLYLLFAHCEVGALIALDDYHRESAQSAVKNWLTVFGSENLQVVETTERFAILRKVNDCLDPRVSWVWRLGSVQSVVLSLAKSARRAVKRAKN